MEEHEHLKLIDQAQDRERTLLVIKRIPVLIRHDEAPQVRFILTTIHEQCYESYIAPLIQNGLKNAAIRTPKIIDVFK